jgi:hypothetical protein
MEEYRTLRQEILTAIGAQHTSLGFGAGTLGILIATGFNIASENHRLTAAILGFLVPLASVVTLTVWLSEIARMLRAGSWLRGLERRVNRALGDRVLGWEEWAHDAATDGAKRSWWGAQGPRNIEEMQFAAVGLAYLMVAAMGVFLGFVYLAKAPGSPGPWGLPLSLLWLLPILSTGIVVFAGIRLRSVYRASDASRNQLPKFPSGWGTVPERERDCWSGP